VDSARAAPRRACCCSPRNLPSSAIVALRGGAFDFLVKPVSTAELVAAVTKGAGRRARIADHRFARRCCPQRLPRTSRPRGAEGARAPIRSKAAAAAQRYDYHTPRRCSWELLLELLGTEQGDHKLSVSALTIPPPPFDSGCVRNNLAAAASVTHRA